MFWWMLLCVFLGSVIGLVVGQLYRLFAVNNKGSLFVSDDPQKIIEWAKKLPPKTHA